MATVFEIRIHHEDHLYAAKAAKAAFDELDRLNALLSRFTHTGDARRINNIPAGQMLCVSKETFECLQVCEKFFKQTEGAFDITYLSKTTGLQLQLDKNNFSVRRPDEKVVVDLGGIGKGFALDKMAELLREWDINSFLLDAGHSTIYAFGTPPGKKDFTFTIKNPLDNKTITDIQLKNRAVSCSSVQFRPHIIDPRTKKVVEDKTAVWVCAPDAATADALSTAFIVMSPLKIEEFCREHPDIAVLILLKESKTIPHKILQFGQCNPVHI
jgi:thiamine biosynthesis lipoprotein